MSGSDVLCNALKYFELLMDLYLRISSWIIILHWIQYQCCVDFGCCTSLGMSILQFWKIIAEGIDPVTRKLIRLKGDLVADVLILSILRVDLIRISHLW